MAPQTNATIFFYGTVNPALPTTEPADSASHYNPVYPPEKYYNYVASPDYVRFQNCASGTLTDKDTGTVVASDDEVCSWMRVRDEFPSVRPRSPCVPTRGRGQARHLLYQRHR